MRLFGSSFLLSLFLVGCAQSGEEASDCGAPPPLQTEQRRDLHLFVHGRTPEIQAQIRNVWIHYNVGIVVSNSIVGADTYACDYVVRNGEDRTEGSFDCPILDILYGQPFLIGVETFDQRNPNHVGGLVGWINSGTDQRNWSVTLQIQEAPIPTFDEMQHGHYWTLHAQENRRGAPSFVAYNGGCPSHQPPSQNYDVCTEGLLSP